MKIVGITMLAGAVGVGAWAMRAPEPEPEPDPAPVAAADPEPVPDPEPAPAPDPEPEPKPEPPVVADPDPTPTPEPPEPTPQPRTTPKPEPTPRGLAEELALVEKIRRAVQAGDHTQALKLSAEHRRDFPKGSLVPDRLDLEATARCKSGQLERGRELAEKRADRWPKAPVSDRMRQACALDEGQGA